MGAGAVTAAGIKGLGRLVELPNLQRQAGVATAPGLKLQKVHQRPAQAAPAMGGVGEDGPRAASGAERREKGGVEEPARGRPSV